MRRAAVIASGIAAGIAFFAFAGGWARVLANPSRSSRSFGTPSRGRLVDGYALPSSGRGFITYSRLGSTLGRQYVHSAVSATLVASFVQLADADPSRTFVVGECGARRGGPFPPHHTHENGMSVDVFVPVLDREGRATHVPTWPWNRFGYGVEFDRTGHLRDERIDFESLGTMLATVAHEAPRHGLRVQRVILAPEFAPMLLATRGARTWPALADVLMRRPAWVRHDEHVHIDFE
jgi:penicillin-insensitive murein endopeptidase